MDTLDKQDATLPPATIPVGFCQCGCGQRTKIAARTNKCWGHVKGEPLRCLRGHKRPGKTTKYAVPRQPIGQPNDPAIRCIPLTLGKVATVDAADYERLRCFNWQAIPKNKTCYARRSVVVDGKPTASYMHQEIIDIPQGMEGDHINRDGLDNRRSNLRAVTKPQNNRNIARRTDATSGYKGVTWSKQKHSWTAQISVDGAHKTLGFFDAPEEAARAYDAAAMQYFGEFACPNFPREQK